MEVLPPGPVGAATFLTEHLEAEVGPVELLGEGAWSKAYGFAHQGQDLVVRFGRHREDFEKDRRAHAWANGDLPVPEVFEVGPVADGWFALSMRSRGIALEQVDADGWASVLPAVQGMFAALAAIDVPTGTGWGEWGGDGTAPHQTWRAHLLSVAEDPPARRTHGWRRRLASLPDQEVAFSTALGQLEELSQDLPEVRGVVHADLLNRNVLVDGARITAVFDWGCSMYGDPLYDLAWFQFWSPWHPALDVSGLTPSGPDVDRRLCCCLLHIGLAHIAYNAYLGDVEGGGDVAERTLGLALGPPCPT